MVTYVVLTVLALVWAAVLVPPWLKNRHERRGASSVSLASFAGQMSMLGSSPGGSRKSKGAAVIPIRRARSRTATPTALSTSMPGVALRVATLNGMAPPTHRTARERRRLILMILGAITGAALVLALVAGGPFVVIAGVMLVLTLAYVGAVVQLQQTIAQHQAKVRPIRPVPETAHAGTSHADLLHRQAL